MIIDWIDFGQVSAERDQNLSSYFFENGVLQSAIENRYRFLILGRKGAGKTAVFQHFNDNSGKYLDADDLSINLSLQNYSWDIHGLLATEGKASSLDYIQSWKYVIYLLAVKALVEAGSADKGIKASSRIIEKIYTSPTPSLGQVVGQKLLQLSKIKLPAAGLDLEGLNLDSFSVSGGEISFADVQKDTSLQAALNRSVERLSEIFETSLLSALKARRIVISFDRIDEAWDAASFEASQRVIAGLVGASEYINAKFKGSIRPLVFFTRRHF